MAGCAVFSSSEDPVLIKLTELEQRLEAIERVMQNTRCAARLLVRLDLTNAIIEVGV